MSDGSSVGGALLDLAKDTGSELGSMPKKIVVGAINQTTNTSSEEKEYQKAQRMANHRRHQEITAELMQISKQNEQRTGPMVTTSQEQSLTNAHEKTEKKLDEASRQAVGRAELGKGFKG